MNIIELAKQAGMEQDGDMWFSNIYKTDMDVHISHLEAFAKLVAAQEREECAKIIKSHGPFLAIGAMLAAAIEARSNT